MPSGKGYVRNAANDGWLVLSNGAGGAGGGATSTYLYLTMSANQTTGIADTNPIKFDTSTGTITYDTGTYRATLSAGVTYELSGAAMTEFSGAGGYTYLIWYDVTNSAQLGTKGISCPFNYAWAISNQPNFFAVVTPLTDIVVEARLDTPTLLTTIHKNYTFARIRSI